MAVPVYSPRFIGASFSGFGSGTYTVPDGYLAVVRDVSAAMTNQLGQGGGSFQVFIHGNCIITWPMPPDFFGSFQWQGRQVVNAAETISYTAQVAGAQAAIAISGYLLKLP